MKCGEDSPPEALLVLIFHIDDGVLFRECRWGWYEESPLDRLELVEVDLKLLDVSESPSATFPHLFSHIVLDLLHHEGDLQIEVCGFEEGSKARSEVGVM